MNIGNGSVHAHPITKDDHRTLVTKVDPPSLMSFAIFFGAGAGAVVPPPGRKGSAAMS
jgi:hypothetical protein